MRVLYTVIIASMQIAATTITVKNVLHLQNVTKVNYTKNKTDANIFKNN